MTRAHPIITAAILGLLAIHTSALAFTDGFSERSIGTAWNVSGPVTLDRTRARDSGGQSLRLGPKARASLKLTDADGSGTLSLWVYDDLTAPAKPKVRRSGPQWGLLQAGGNVLVVGSIYAPYLNGAATFATAEYNPAQGQPWHKLQYLGERRKKGWHQWTFTMDANTGLSLAYDGKPVKRFKWNATAFSGFAGIVLLGDSKAQDAQTLWVDDVELVSGSAMTAKPVPPPPPAPVVPDKDPELVGSPIRLVQDVRGRHPRLFFGSEDIAALREKALAPAMKPYWNDLLGYVAACNPPNHTRFLTDATDGQRQGLWRMPTLALHYLITEDKESRDKAVGFMKILLGLKHWETGKELDSGMSSANVMIGAAICYDSLYDQLDPAFREDFRRKLLHMARAQYHGGHLNKNKSTGYWQADPANNHRWHRNAGMLLAVLAAFEGKPDEQWILNKAAEDVAFVAKWLPEDGTSHESPTYLSFGLPHLTLALQAADRCLGTRYLDLPFAWQVAHFKMQTITPGFTTGFQFGDSSGVGGYNHSLWLYTARHGQADLQAGFERLHANDAKSFQFGWMAVLWKDPSLVGGDIAALQTTTFFPDIGLALMRDSWKKDGTAAMFKCGPLGGHTLNRYRNENGFKYINVAHDDPDANSFTLFTRGAFLAETDRYSKHKRSANHNTILVNGKGQRVAGRKEGAGWSQPARGKVDMTQLAFITAWKDAGDVVIIEGEAGGSYPDLTRFRRTFVWVRGQYILVLDDIQAPRDVDITWLLQAPELRVGNGNTYTLRKGSVSCPVAIAADRPFKNNIETSTADHGGKPLGWQQLQLQCRTAAWRVASLYAPWQQGNLKLGLECPDPRQARIHITAPSINDTWHWTRAQKQTSPSSLKGKADLTPN